MVNKEGWGPREHFEWQRENLIGTIKLADEGIRSLILVNGAAAAGLLTFYGSIVGNKVALPLIARHQFTAALTCFGTGVGFAAICGILAFCSQRTAALERYPKAENTLTIISLLAAIVSFACFMRGITFAGAALP